jgi:hypothetical protein
MVAMSGDGDMHWLYYGDFSQCLCIVKYQVCALNIYNFCQLYLNKSRINKKKSYLKLTTKNK